MNGPDRRPRSVLETGWVSHYSLVAPLGYPWQVDGSTALAKRRLARRQWISWRR